MTQRSMCVLLGTITILTSACWGEPASHRLGKPGLSASYQIADTPAPTATSVVQTFSISLGPEETWRTMKGQWLHIKFTKRNATTFDVWLLCNHYPSDELRTARGTVLRYLLRADNARVFEYRHAVTPRPARRWR